MTAPDPIAFVHDLDWSDLSEAHRLQAKMNLLDLLAVAAAGSQTRLSAIIRDHAAEEFGGPLPMLFDGRGASASGVALAAGMTIDSIDAHDGFNMAKGHIGCPLLAAMLPLAQGREISGRAFLTALVAGYEFGARASVAQHGTVPDYHTSGSWGAVTGAAIGARMLGLGREATRHALGIAEYHGPRSQMMRCIDHPTMLKDGSGWGAMCAVSAVGLAAKGFTGAPAITVEEAPEYWADLGQRWYVLEQYYKPYPVCRWAQAPIEGVLALVRQHGLQSQQVARIEVRTFHESIRLAMAEPKASDEAQYSTSFPCAVALVRGDVTPADIADDALSDPEILRLSRGMVMVEDDTANATFPATRLAKVTLKLTDGQRLESDWMQPRWDPTAPPSEAELREKFHKYADPVLGKARAAAIEDAIDALDRTPFSALTQHLYQPINS
jgi:2-methylcitrate dehydratase PrpD